MSLLAALSLSACIQQVEIAPGLAVSEPDASLGQEAVIDRGDASDVALRPADTISVTVFREPDLSADGVMISAGGYISLPLVGEIQAAGLSPAELEARLEGILGRQFLRSPDVAVNVTNYGSHMVTVEGQVESPGIYQFRPGTRLSGGIALAEGTTRVAQIRDVAVFRETAEGVAIAKFDYAQVRAGRMLDPVLQPGDRIVVGTDSLSQYWQDVLQSLPVFALFTQI